jgi:hypothetical protein
MAGTFEAIQTYTVPSATNLVTFSSISSAYTDLFIVFGSWRTSVSTDSVAMYYNNDTGSNYGINGYYANGNGNGSSTGQFGYSANTTAGTSAWLDSMAGHPSTSGQINIYISRYSDSTINKTAVVRSGNSAQSTESSCHQWYSTAAINRIDFKVQGSDTLSTGTVITLFGIKAA